MNPLVVVIVVIFFGVASFAVGIGMLFSIHWAARPIDRRAAPLPSLRFRLSDVFCLALQWQLLLAAGISLDRNVGNPGRGLPIMLAVLVCGIVLAVWTNSVTRLNQAGILSSGRRSAFIMLQPLTLAAAVAGAPLAPLLGLSMLDLILGPLPASFSNVSVIACGLLGVALTIVFSRFVSQWIAAEKASAPAAESRPSPIYRDAAAEGGSIGAVKEPTDDSAQASRP